MLIELFLWRIDLSLLFSSEMRPIKLGDNLSLAVVVALLMLAQRMVHVPFEPVPLVVVLIDTGLDTVNLMMSALVHHILK